MGKLTARGLAAAQVGGNRTCGVKRLLGLYSREGKNYSCIEASNYELLAC